MTNITFNNTEVNYQVVGNGFPVVLLHGFCEDQSIWDEFKLNLVDQNYQVITLDHPGFGNSGIPTHASIKFMADCVHAVLEHLQVSNSIMIGHSMGGYVSLAFAEKYGSQLSGLGLFHSHCFEDSPEKKVLILFPNMDQHLM